VATISLGRALPRASSNLPGTRARRATSSSPIWSCSGWGLPSRRRRRLRWCALTAPFHPCLGPKPAAVCFLWHFPWDRSRWGLPSTLPCGARTFLEPRLTRRPRPPVVLRMADACLLRFMRVRVDAPRIKRRHRESECPAPPRLSKERPPDPDPGGDSGRRRFPPASAASLPGRPRAASTVAALRSRIRRTG